MPCIQWNKYLKIKTLRTSSLAASFCVNTILVRQEKAGTKFKQNKPNACWCRMQTWFCTCIAHEAMMSVSFYCLTNPRTLHLGQETAGNLNFLCCLAKTCTPFFRSSVRLCHLIQKVSTQQHLNPRRLCCTWNVKQNPPNFSASKVQSACLPNNHTLLHLLAKKAAIAVISLSWKFHPRKGQALWLRFSSQNLSKAHACGHACPNSSCRGWW